MGNRGLKKKVRFKKRFYIIAILVVILAIVGVQYLNKVKKIVTVEAGMEIPNASQFIKNEKNQGSYKTDPATIDMRKPGDYKIEIQIGKKVYTSKLHIVDTVAPVADAVSREIWVNDEVDAEEFVENIQDGSEVKVSFKESADFSQAGEEERIIVLEDAGGNQTELTVSIIVKEDTESPEIKGTKDQTVYIGDKVSYKKDVTVTDNRDENVTLEVESSTVNLKKAGSYDVTYSATDASGNKTSKKVTFTVKEKPKGYVSEDEVHALADQVLASIINDNMTLKEKAKAIYNWTRNQIQYVDSSNKSDWLQAAYRGMKKRNGDCYVYYATAQELLTKAGIENQPIIKTNHGHYWNLVNLGNGWYHFDTTPRRAGGEFFMLTDAEIEEYSRKNKNSHVWDKNKYPATPLE